MGKTNFYPFFSIMDPHEYVNLMLDALHELANSTEGNMTVLLSRELGYRVQRKYLIRRKIKMGVADKASSGPNFMALLTAEFCAYDHHSLLTYKRRISALAL